MTQTSIAEVVRSGLSARVKNLPAWLLYDETGSVLFDEITRLPEYYPTRVERSIFAQYADEMLLAAANGRHLTLIELGAGTADKTRVLLAALIRLQGDSDYVPVDVSVSALHVAEQRIAAELPRIRVRSLVCETEEVPEALRAIEGRKLVLFIGSSIGNYDEDAAVALLSGVANGLNPGDMLLLGTDMRKELKVLLPAYDDAAQVTAAFNRNLLVRLNAELSANFDVAQFKHLARWNEEKSRVEMHLQSACVQSAHIGALDVNVHFDEGETIHTESSVKYDADMVERMLVRSGFRSERTFSDPDGWFAVHLAKVI